MVKRQPQARPVAVKDVLRDLLGPGDRQALEQRQLIRQVWETALPPALRAQTRLTDFRRKELWVEVASSAVSQELQFLKPRLMEELSRALGPGVVTDVRFRVGEGFADR